MLVDPDAQAGLAPESATLENGAVSDGQGAEPTAANGALYGPGADEEEYTILVPTTDMSTAGRLIQVAAALMPVD